MYGKEPILYSCDPGKSEKFLADLQGGGGTGKSNIHSDFFVSWPPPSIYSNFGHVDMFSTNYYLTIIFYSLHSSTNYYIAQLV